MTRVNDKISRTKKRGKKKVISNFFITFDRSSMNFSRKLLFFFLSRNFASTTGNPCRGEIPLINNVCFRRQVWKKKKNWKEEKIEKKSRNRRSLIKFHKSFSCYGSIHQVTSRNQTSLAFMEICRKPSC